MLGEVLVCPTAGGTFAAGDDCEITHGFAVVSTDAAAVASAAGLPDPADEPGYPWLWWHQSRYNFQDATPDESIGRSLQRIPFDIRSMRKVKPRETLVMVHQYTTLAGAPPMDVLEASTRVLVGLH